jgi:hypothetical protein
VELQLAGKRWRASDGRTLASGDGYSTVENMGHGIEEAEAVLCLAKKDLERRDTSSLWMRSEHVD